jgi:uncharacterized protein (TIGR02996 family)
MTSREMIEAVVARRLEWRNDTAAIGGFEGTRWTTAELQAIGVVEQRAGWARYATRFVPMAVALSNAAIARAVDELNRDGGRTFALSTACVRAVLDGYVLGCVLTGAGGDGRGRTVKSAASSSAFAARAVRAGAAIEAIEELREALAALGGDSLKDGSDEERTFARTAVRNAFAAGIVLHHFETEATHPIVDRVRSAASKPKAAPERDAREAPPNPALVDAILAAPDDDEPRLIYADWLTEHGDPRGQIHRCSDRGLDPGRISVGGVTA